MKLNEEIESNQPDVFGTFFIDRQVQSFLEKFEPNTDTLFRWIQLTKGGVHSGGFWLGTNAANLLMRISQDYFAGKDLSDTTLQEVSLWGADLRRTQLNNTQLQGAFLTNARFFREDIVFSRIDNARVSLYVLKTSKIRKYEVEEFYRLVSDEIGIERGLGLAMLSPFRGDLLYELDVTIKDLQDLEFLRDKLSAALSTKVVIYFDECDKLVRSQNSAKPKRNR